MRYREITEAPLADFGTFGDPDVEGSFRSDDLKAMKSPAWRKKINNAFKRSPHKFNVYLYNGENGIARVTPKKPFWDKSQSSDEPMDVKSLRHVERYAGIQPLSVIEGMIGKLPPDAANSINVVLVENEGAQRMPLTAWILVHRIAHTIIYAKVATNFRATIDSFIIDIMKHLRKDSMSFETVDGLEARMMLAASMIGKTKAVRTNNLSNEGEFFVETMTQYIVNGRISFHHPTLKDGSLQLALDRMIDRYEVKLNDQMDQVLGRCVGLALVL
jgi:hypothetical protein